MSGKTPSLPIVVVFVCEVVVVVVVVDHRHFYWQRVAYGMYEFLADIESP